MPSSLGSQLSSDTTLIYYAPSFCRRSSCALIATTMVLTDISTALIGEDADVHHQADHALALAAGGPLERCEGFGQDQVQAFQPARAADMPLCWLPRSSGRFCANTGRGGRSNGIRGAARSTPGTALLYPLSSRRAVTTPAPISAAQSPDAAAPH